METTTTHYQELQPEDRVTISSLKQQNQSIRAALMVQRPASTISRELRRNGSIDHYGSVEVQQVCQRRRCQSRPRHKLHAEGLLFGVVQHFLQQR
jgi:IS30 family transposase